MKNKSLIPIGLITGGLALLLFKKKANAAPVPGEHLFFTVQYLDWPIQEIDITTTLENHRGYTVADMRSLYSHDGYTILREYYQAV